MAVLLGADGLRVNISLDAAQAVALEELINFVLVNKTDAEDIIATRLRKEFPMSMAYSATEVEYMLGQVSTAFKRIITPAKAAQLHAEAEEHDEECPLHPANQTKKGFGPN